MLALIWLHVVRDTGPGDQLYADDVIVFSRGDFQQTSQLEMIPQLIRVFSLTFVLGLHPHVATEAFFISFTFLLSSSLPNCWNSPVILSHSLVSCPPVFLDPSHSITFLVFLTLSTLLMEREKKKKSFLLSVAEAWSSSPSHSSHTRPSSSVSYTSSSLHQTPLFSHLFHSIISWLFSSHLSSSCSKPV